MLNKWWHSLSIRTGLYLATIALVLNALFGAVLYQDQYHKSIASASIQIGQLFSIIERSASIAAYLYNQELGADVVGGLVNNDLVIGALIKTKDDRLVAEAGATLKCTSDAQKFPLVLTFLDQGDTGSLYICLNKILIDDNAKRTAIYNSVTNATYTTIIVLLVIVLVYINLTNPLKLLTKDLHGIAPGSNGRLVCPRGHTMDEIGLMVHDTNALLDSTQILVTTERQLHENVERLEKQFRLVFEKASAGIALVQVDGLVILSNPSFKKILRLAENIDVETLNFFSHFLDTEKLKEVFHQVNLHNEPTSVDLELIQNNQEESRQWVTLIISLVVDVDGDSRFECILYDISDRVSRESAIKIQAETDELTQLYNRRAGVELIGNALKDVSLSGKRCAVMLIDLDRFKPINDTYGHEGGDKVLVEVSNRLKNSFRQSDIIVRWGGDEFVIVAQQGRTELNPTAIAKKILDQFVEPIDLGKNRKDTVGASIGVAIYPDHGRDLDTLIDLADRSMYSTKQKGRNGFSIVGEE